MGQPQQSPFSGTIAAEDVATLLYPRYRHVEELLLGASKASKKNSLPGGAGTADAPTVLQSCEADARKAKKKDKKRKQLDSGSGHVTVANHKLCKALAGKLATCENLELALLADAQILAPKVEVAPQPAEQVELSVEERKALKRAKRANRVRTPKEMADSPKQSSAERPVAEQPSVSEQHKRKLDRRAEKLAGQTAAAKTGLQLTGEGEQAQPRVAGTSGSGNAEEAAQIRSLLGFTTTSKQQADAEKPSTASRFKFGFSVEEKVAHKAEQKLAHILAVDSSKDGFVPRRVFICGMPHECTEAELLEYWSYCGEVESHELMRFPDSGNFNGVMFITFKTQEAYEAALQYNGTEVEGRSIRVEKCKAVAEKKTKQQQATSYAQKHQQSHSDKPQKTPGYNVAYVGNIAFETTEEELTKLFKGCSRVRMHTDQHSGRFKGYAHIHFDDEGALDEAMALDGKSLHGRKIRVGYAQPKKTSEA